MTPRIFCATAALLLSFGLSVDARAEARHRGVHVAAQQGSAPATEPARTIPQAADQKAVRIGAVVQFRPGSAMRIISTQGADVIVQWTTDVGDVVTVTVPATAVTETTGSKDGSTAQKRRSEERYTYKPCRSSVFLNGRNVCL
jgi:hypothetical protein